MPPAWYWIANADEIPTPALAVFPDRVESNIRRMVDMAGGTRRLWPHVKTHKMAEVVRMEQQAGIDKFKCSTLSEAEMAASCGAVQVLLALPQLGPNLERLARLAAAFAETRFITVADDGPAIRAMSARWSSQRRPLGVLLDIDNGMHRTGIAPGSAARELYRLLVELPGIEPAGLHVYDGQVREQQLAERIEHGERDFAPVADFVAALRAEGWPVPHLVCGGTPAFPVHARHADRDLSPGTCVFWDVSYATKFPDLVFDYAALLVGRVISKPGEGRLCFDLGYKAVSPDNPELRVQLLDLPDARVINHSEEHLAVETPAAGRFKVGDVVYGVPFHVCPTVALHREAVVVRGQQAVERWQVAARDRRLTY